MSWLARLDAFEWARLVLATATFLAAAWMVASSVPEDPPEGHWETAPPPPGAAAGTLCWTFVEAGSSRPAAAWCQFPTAEVTP